VDTLRCTVCGVEGEAKCHCGKTYAYIPAHKAAELAIKAYPDWSNRKIAEAIGVSFETIRRARPIDTNASVEKRLGRDGRKRGKRKPNRKPGEKQAQRSINLRPDAWEEIKRKAEAANVSTAAYIGAVLQQAELDLATLPKTAQDKLDAFRRQYQRELDRQFEEAVHKEIKRRVDEYVAPRFLERERDADRCRQAQRSKGVFKKEEYNIILRCVHPDLSPTVEQKNEAFRLLHENRLLLLSEKDDPRTYPPLPTAEEFMAGVRRYKR